MVSLIMPPDTPSQSLQLEGRQIPSGSHSAPTPRGTTVERPLWQLTINPSKAQDALYWAEGLIPRLLWALPL
jgi:hypothetical protein